MSDSEYEAVEASKLVSLTRENRRRIIEEYERSGAADRLWSGQPDVPREQSTGFKFATAAPQFYKTAILSTAARIKARGFTFAGCERGPNNEIVYKFAERHQQDSRGQWVKEPWHTAELIESRKLRSSVNPILEEKALEAAVQELQGAKSAFERSESR